MPVFKIVELKKGAPVPEGDAGSIVVGEALAPEEVIAAALHGARHIVQADAPFFDSEIALAKTMVESPNQFFDDPIMSIIGKPLDSEGLLSLKVECSADEKKVRTLYRFENFLKAIPGTKMILENALLIADELYTNAARNAHPRAASGGSGPAREGSVEFIACVDEKRLVFGCVDSFGELSVNRLVERIQDCLHRGVAEAMQVGTVGAGIGSYMVFSRAMSYYIGVTMGRRSVVMVSIPLGLSSKSVADIPKNLHLLSIVG
jgi:hypothetical protein